MFLSSHVLAEVESTCDRIGVVRGGRMVTVGTVEELKRAGATAREDRVQQPGDRRASRGPGRHGPFGDIDPRLFEVRGPLGPLLQALAAFPIHDVQEEPFRLEDYIVKFYASRES